MQLFSKDLTEIFKFLFLLYCFLPNKAVFAYANTYFRIKNTGFEYFKFESTYKYVVILIEQNTNKNALLLALKLFQLTSTCNEYEH